MLNFISAFDVIRLEKLQSVLITKERIVAPIKAAPFAKDGVNENIRIRNIAITKCTPVISKPVNANRTAFLGKVVFKNFVLEIIA